MGMVEITKEVGMIVLMGEIAVNWVQRVFDGDVVKGGRPALDGRTIGHRQRA